MPRGYPERQPGTPIVAQNVSKLTKTLVENLIRHQNEYTVWEDALTGFGVRVRPSGFKTFVYVYRAGTGRSAPQRRITIGSVQKLTVEQAREQAKKLAAFVTQGRDPASERNHERSSITVSDLIDSFLQRHVATKRKPRTARSYGDVLNRIVRPRFGAIKANKLARSELIKLHHDLQKTPYQANRVVRVMGSMYTYADRAGLVPEGTNPARKIELYKEAQHERPLTDDELRRLGEVFIEGETIGLPWSVDETKPTSKHIPKSHRRTLIDRYAIAALKLLILTGARLGEILNLRWEHVDMSLGSALLPDSKTGKKTIPVNTAAQAILRSLPKGGSFVIAGKDPERPRADLHRPWKMILKRAGIRGVRIHDLRHTYATRGAEAGYSTSILAKLLGHSQLKTTERYTHIRNDPVKRASEQIGIGLSIAMGDTETVIDNPSAVLPFKRTVSS
jgi:integrase